MMQLPVASLLPLFLLSPSPRGLCLFLQDDRSMPRHGRRPPQVRSAPLRTSSASRLPERQGLVPELDLALRLVKSRAKPLRRRSSCATACLLPLLRRDERSPACVDQVPASSPASSSRVEQLAWPSASSLVSIWAWPMFAGADETVQVTQPSSRRSSMKTLLIVLFCSSRSVVEPSWGRSGTFVAFGVLLLFWLRSRALFVLG
ncbi:hypothetical protein ACQJBY_048305 [Aegilops geniculata]